MKWLNTTGLCIGGGGWNCDEGVSTICTWGGMYMMGCCICCGICVKDGMFGGVIAMFAVMSLDLGCDSDSLVVDVGDDFSICATAVMNVFSGLRMNCPWYGCFSTYCFVYSVRANLVDFASGKRSVLKWSMYMCCHWNQ